MAKQKAEHEHAADVDRFARFAAGKSKAATKAGRGDEAEVWAQAVDNIADHSVWTIHPIIRSCPEITQFAGLQTRLAYEGQNVQLAD